MQLFNTLSHKIEQLDLQKNKVINMYSCGPTVYNKAHIGNLRSFIIPDILYRTLKANGYKVKWVMNITDIDDKTIQGTIDKYGNQATTTDLYDYTQTFLDDFLIDLKKVNISVDEIQIMRVTEIMDEMQKFIIKLIEQGFAYIANDGSTYFSIQKYQDKFGDYGQLMGDGFMQGKKVGARVAVDEYDKDDLSDFALWKAYDAQTDAAIFWDNQILGKGRPGWHIECSVMNDYMFNGNPTDIHTGGIDLTFPHHTNEISQSQPFYEPFTRYWFHIEHLMVDNNKMSKRFKNFYTLSDLEAKEKNAGMYLRYFFLQSHYSKQQNFTFEGLKAARTALHRLLHKAKNSSSINQELSTIFLDKLGDNLNTAEALASLWENEQFTLSDLEVLGLSEAIEAEDEIAISEELQALLDQRKIAKNEKNYQLADTLRTEIENKGYKVIDSQDGQEIIHN